MVRQSISVALAGLIVLNSPASSLVQAEPSSTLSAAGDLSLFTDPVGAGVYVDGVFAGRTPVTLRGVPAGDHRVRIVKDGYLENARVVSVDAGQPTRLQVRLTRDARAATAPFGQVQVAVTKEDSPSSLRWVLLALAGGGVGGYLYATKLKGNKAPVAGSVAVSPTSGLVGSTSISFSAAAASDPDGDSLTFDWNFGDQQHGTGASPTHVYNSTGTFTVMLTVSDGKDTASATGTVVIQSLTGTWKGPLVSNTTTYNTTLMLTQTGAAVTGTYSDHLLNSGTVSGSVTPGSSPVSLSVTVGSFDPFTFTGSPAANADALTGTANGVALTATWTLTRQ